MHPRLLMRHEQSVTVKTGVATSRFIRSSMVIACLFCFLPTLASGQAPAGADVLPIYRYWSPTLADHLYTTDPYEFGCVPPSLYTFEGFDGMVMRTEVAGTVPLHRFWRPGSNESAGHFYTTDPTTAPSGYEFIGTIGYIFTSQVPGTVAFRSWTRIQGTTIIDSFYTTHDHEPLPGDRPLYTDNGPVGYVYPYPTNGPTCGNYSYDTLTYLFHLHQEVGTDGNLLLKAEGPDTAARIESLAVTDALTGSNTAVKSYSLPAGTPNLTSIQSGTQFSFSLWMRKTATAATLLAWAAVELTGGGPAMPVCNARAGLPLTRSFVLYTFQCVADTNTPVRPGDRITLRAGFFTQAGPGNRSVSVELGTEGVLDANYDSKLGFTVVPSPYITTLGPATGNVGDAVLILGSRFGVLQGSGSVQFGGVPAQIASWSDTLIAALVPFGAETGPVIVIANSMPSNSVLFAVAATSDPGGLPSFYHSDSIGSVRMITDSAGQVVSRYDYLPFGQDFPAVPSTDPNNIRFAGKERERQTGAEGLGWSPLDYFGARYYQGQTGRFTSVDPVTTLEDNLIDPQRWNRYVYVRNNPLRYVDPDGRAVDTLVDVGSILYDVFDIARSVVRGEKVTGTQWGALGGDVVGAAVPFVAGVGIGIRAAKVADAARDASRAVEGTTVTSRAARRSAMREAGIPTSQQPISQLKTTGGRQYVYETPRPGGGTQKQVVTQHLSDRVDNHGPHWEAGAAKTPERRDPLGRIRVVNQKAKVPYDE